LEAACASAARFFPPGADPAEVYPTLKLVRFDLKQIAEFARSADVADIDIAHRLRELAFQIPDNVWPPGAQRIVDVDKTKPFGFGLR
jgi:hypothetical protein